MFIIFQTESPAMKETMEIKPRHDPLNINALVMPRPSSSHQVIVEGHLYKSIEI